MLVTGLLASFKTPGWRIPAWGAGFTAAVLGAASVVYPEQAPSVGVLWGTLALLWGAVFIMAAEWQRRDRTSDRGARVHLAAQAREARSANH